MQLTAAFGSGSNKQFINLFLREVLLLKLADNLVGGNRAVPNGGIEVFSPVEAERC